MYGWDVAHRLVIDAWEDRLVGYMDDVFLFDVRDPDRRTGRVGLYTWKNGAASFDALQVEALERDAMLWHPPLADAAVFHRSAPRGASKARVWGRHRELDRALAARFQRKSRLRGRLAGARDPGSGLRTSSARPSARAAQAASPPSMDDSPSSRSERFMSLRQMTCVIGTSACSVSRSTRPSATSSRAPASARRSRAPTWA